MKEYIQATAVKAEEKKDEKTGAIIYRVVLEVVDTITVNSFVKPELNKNQLFEIRRHDFTDKETGKQVKGFKILGTAK